MPVQMPKPLSSSAQAKFRRMLKQLDLAPYTDDSRRDLRLAVNQVAEESDDESLVAPEIDDAEPMLRGV